jgi:hypothetical protein
MPSRAQASKMLLSRWCRDSRRCGDLLAQMRVERVPLHDARRGAAIGDRVRPTARQLVDGMFAVGAVHLDDALGRGAGRHQHAGEMNADPVRHGLWVPRLDDAVDARHDDPEPDFP